MTQIPIIIGDEERMRKNEIAKWLFLAVLLILSMFLTPLPVYATDESELEQLSTHIVIGVVESMEYQQDEQGRISTYVTLSVEQYLKGNGASTITIRTRGGEVDGLVEWVSSEATFGLGERAKVLLVKEGSSFFVVRGAEGKVTLDGSLSAVESSSSDDEIGYKLTYVGGGPWHWERTGMPIQYYMNELGSEDTDGEFQAVQLAFQTWENEPYSFVDFSYMGTTNKNPDVRDNYNVVGWVWRPADPRPAYATVWYVPAIDLIVEADITFNEYESWGISPPWWEFKFDVQHAATHEVGHFIGLNDLTNSYNRIETMHSDIGLPGDTSKRDLGPGDIAGVRYLYHHPTRATFVEKPYDEAFVDGWAGLGATHHEYADPVTGKLKFYADSGLLFQGAWALASVSKTYTPASASIYPTIIYALHIRTWWGGLGITDRHLDVYSKIYNPSGTVVAENWKGLSLWPPEGGDKSRTYSYVFTGPLSMETAQYTIEIGIRASVGWGAAIHGWDESKPWAPSYALWTEVLVPDDYTLTIQADTGGTTSPSPGSYVSDHGTTVPVTASPYTNYAFDYWKLDGTIYSYSTTTSVTMYSDHTLKAWFHYTGGTSGCVAEGTLVTMADGTSKPIEETKKGDQVLGFDPTTGSYMAENVLGVTKTKVEVIVNLNNGALKLTPLDQPIFIRNATYEGWVRDPATIQVGWEIYEPKTGTWVTVTSMTYEEGKTRVYDLVLDGYTTYIANGILLMDKC